MASDLFQADDPQAPCTGPGRLSSRSGRALSVVIVLFFLLQLEYKLYLAPSAVRTQHLADRHKYRRYLLYGLERDKRSIQLRKDTNGSLRITSSVILRALAHLLSRRDYM